MFAHMANYSEKLETQLNLSFFLTEFVADMLPFLKIIILLLLVFILTEIKSTDYCVTNLRGNAIISVRGALWFTGLIKITME